MNDLHRLEQDTFARLTTEWSWVFAEPGNATLVFGWLQDAGVLAPEDQPSDLGPLLPLMQQRDRAHGRAHSDAWLGALLRHAAGDGTRAQLAARVVVQTMLPAALRTTRRLLRADGRRFDEVAQVVVASLFQVVRCYPLARRPQKVAANLAMEMLHRRRGSCSARLSPAAMCCTRTTSTSPGRPRPARRRRAIR